MLLLFQLVLFWVAVFYLGVGMGIFTPKRSRGLERRGEGMWNVLEKIIKGGGGGGVLGGGRMNVNRNKKKQF